MELARAFDPRMGGRPTVPAQHPPKGAAMKPNTSARSAKPPPTRNQLAYLRSLANRSETTFTYPRTSAQASAEIKRLQALGESSAADRTREQRAVQRDLAERPNDAAKVRFEETRGYGSSARWASDASEDRR